MRKALFIAAAMLLAGSAHADFIPQVISGTNSVILSANNSSLSYSENRAANGPLGALIVDAQNVPYQIQYALNTAVANAVNSQGARFGSGTLTGLPTITLRPSSSGVIYVTLSGLSYRFNASYSGTKAGIINFSCTNTTYYNNITITAQLGSADGALPPNKIGINGNLSTSTDCDSNLTWMLPVLGSILVNKAEGAVDSAIANSIQSGLSSVTQKFFFLRDQNWQVGLQRLIPADKVVGGFAIGQYIQNNLAYLISNSQISMTVGGGADMKPVVGTNEPPRQLGGDAISLTLTSPGLSFSVKLHEEVNVFWKWKCSVANPALNCADPR